MSSHLIALAQELVGGEEEAELLHLGLEGVNGVLVGLDALADGLEVAGQVVELLIGEVELVALVEPLVDRPQRRQTAIVKVGRRMA